VPLTTKNSPLLEPFTTKKMAKSSYLVPLAFFTLLLFLHEAMARIPINSKWHNASATFYGDINGGETMRKYIKINKLPFF